MAKQMNMRAVRLALKKFFRRPFSSKQTNAGRSREPQTHVIILDGTMSSLEAGMETNAGQTYRLMKEVTPSVSLFYEAGVQFKRWKNAPDVMMGRGINRQIRRAYGFLASRYKPGDKIYLFGYSRGAFAVRSLAGVIDRVGLLEATHATERNIRQAYRHYQGNPDSDPARAFSAAFCYQNVDIEVIGVWDTVKALGMRLPILWRWAEIKHAFHNHHLGHNVKKGFHALALHETRQVYEPVLWTCDEGEPCRADQVWFPGTHGDVGGQLKGNEESRPLANVSLVWMLQNAEENGLPLPSDWQLRFPTDVTAPSVSTWSGWGKLFLLRRKRKVGQDKSERLHKTAQAFETKRTLLSRFKLRDA